MRDDSPAITSPGEESLNTGSEEQTPIRVRLAEARDVGGIVTLAEEVQAWHVTGRPDLFKPGGCDIAAEILERIANPAQFYWVATLDDTLVGYAYARLFVEPESRWRYGSRQLIVDQMGVAEPYRRRGVGELLWNAVRAAAVGERVERVILNVWSFNAGARQFYERMGFKPFHERMAVELRSNDERESR